MLEGRTALVTGGSRGIGSAIVLAFLREGARVFYASRTEGDLAAFKEEASRSGAEVRFLPCDIADGTRLSQVVSEVLEAGGVDILVNNAGITRDGLIFRMTQSDWSDVLATNLTSAFIASKAVAYHMIKRRAGSIVNMSSVVGLLGNAGQTNYAASKAGLIGFTKSLAREVASRGVRVNAIAPGFIETAMTERMGDKHKEAMLAQIPLARPGLPGEVAQAALFLASDMSSYITGQVIQIDGGLGM